MKTGTPMIAPTLLMAWFAASLPVAATDWRTLPFITNGRIDPAWQQVDWGGFVVDQGALRTQPDPRGMGLLVYTRAAFGDCRIRVVYRSEKPSSNAGVFVRLDPGILQRLGEKTEGVERGPNNQLSPPMLARMTASSEKQAGAWYAVHHGFEVQIQDSGDSWHRTGAIYSLAEAVEAKARPGAEWRTMIITLEGSRISVTVDGKAVSSFDSSAKNLPARRSWSEPVRENVRPNKGYIGLQNHDPGDVVWFKEVAVAGLKD
ncbi:MAG: DUF1080 domain-containing protein [Bryobacterales bacterium]|nr:DUF1080 domain-containing protein [Bryobacterales bacterium]